MDDVYNTLETILIRIISQHYQNINIVYNEALQKNHQKEHYRQKESLKLLENPKI